MAVPHFAALHFQEARETVIARVRQFRRSLSRQQVTPLESVSRVLAEPVLADRDFPPFHRSTRDGFAVRSADTASASARLRIVGEVKAGDSFPGMVGEGECVEIMTGAPVPVGTDAVVMVEHTSPQGNCVEVQRSVANGENVVAKGSEARQGDRLLDAGRRIGYAELAMMVAVGKQSVEVFERPRVAILPTGDEVVDLGVMPGPQQIRNSNSYSLQAQVATAGGVPVPLGIAPDREDVLRGMIEQGLGCALLLLSGGVSAGKFDLVEAVLAQFDAEFFFDGVLIQPGRPLVFGRARNTLFFGLPGNPLSTMVTFELFVRPAMDLLAGAEPPPFAPLRAKLGRGVRRKPGLAAFLPARLDSKEAEPVVAPVEWKGSGDLASLTRANCYLVVPEDAAEIQAGEWVAVLPR
jgi:molybdopterin molybdotransferase